METIVNCNTKHDEKVMEEKDRKQTLLEGILFRRSIRASYASCDLVVIGKEEREEHVVVLIQFAESYDSALTSKSDGPFTNESGKEENSNMTNIRSYIRRFLQLGHTLQFFDGDWLSPDDSYNSNESVEKNDGDEMNTETKPKKRIRRFEIIMPRSSRSNDQTFEIFENHPDHYEEMMNRSWIINMNPIRTWNVHQCQEARCRYYPKWEMNPKHLRPHNKIKNFKNMNINKDNDHSIADKGASMKKRKQKACQGQTGHGGGIGKRQQGQVIADFLIELFISQIGKNCQNDLRQNIEEDDDDISSIPTFLSKSQDTNDDDNSKCHSDNDDSSNEKKILAIHDLSQGSGVLDIAGGSGHVSMALSLKGIPSTVIDPRFNVGKLPGRDRKIYKRALQKQKLPSPTDGSNDCNYQKITITPTPYSTFRAWFGNKPSGVDVEFRQQENNNPSTKEEEIPILCQPCSPDDGNNKNDFLVRDASAIVALHPDEATESIVDVCVKYGKPFVVVPCCVFSRLFPNRLKPLKKWSSLSTKRELVTTYDDFIDYLCAKHPSIQKTHLLNFDGANLALWSTFS